MSERKYPLHAKDPCASCPFRKRPRPGSFRASVLDETIGENLRGGEYVHRCHQEEKGEHQLCVGYIRFVVANDVPNKLMRMGRRFGAIDLSAIRDDVEIHLDWQEMLDDHLEETGS